MAGRLAGKRALVTAAGAGIGRACAAAFAAEGAAVIATDIDLAALRSLARETPAVETEPLDATDDDAVAAFAAGHPPIDVLLNAAGIVLSGTILDCAPDEWAKTFEVNVGSMYRVIRAFLPGMIAAGGGAIVNIASVASSVRGVADRCAYGASKAAVIGLTKSVAADFVGRGIRCNAICPGTIDTPSLRARIAASNDPAAARALFIARQPMGRLGNAREIAALAVHLAADEAAFTTGQAFVVDGGWSG